MSAGVIISGGRVLRSVIGPQARVNSYAEIEDSIIFADVNVGRGAKIRQAIIDKGVDIPAGMHVGYDIDADRRNGCIISESGVRVIAKGDGQESFGVARAEEPVQAVSSL